MRRPNVTPEDVRAAKQAGVSPMAAARGRIAAAMLDRIADHCDPPAAPPLLRRRAADRHQWPRREADPEE